MPVSSAIHCITFFRFNVIFADLTFCLVLPPYQYRTITLPKTLMNSSAADNRAFALAYTRVGVGQKEPSLLSLSKQFGGFILCQSNFIKQRIHSISEVGIIYRSILSPELSSPRN